jgi:hypothetical protein
MTAVIDFDLKSLEEMQQEVDDHTNEIRYTLMDGLRHAVPK